MTSKYKDWDKWRKNISEAKLKKKEKWYNKELSFFETMYILLAMIWGYSIIGRVLGSLAQMIIGTIFIAVGIIGLILKKEGKK